MPNSLKCRLKNLVRNGLLRERDLKRIIIILPNATNGEVIKAMFPNAEYDYHEKSELVDAHVTVSINGCDTYQDYSMDWWNTSYEIDQEVEE